MSSLKVNHPSAKIKPLAGVKSRYTKKMMPLRLVHVEICNSRIKARKVEKYFKSGYGREIVKELSEVI